MQFLVVGLDGTDAEALDRRLAVRGDHIASGEKLMESGNFWFGGAIIDDEKKMIGSALIMNFPSRKELDEWLEGEAYIKGDVWKDVQIYDLSVRDPWLFSKDKEFFESVS